MNENITKLQNMIDSSNKIVFFGGAGVSTASGIPDFRSENGLYNGKQKWKYKPEYMLSHKFFEKHTEEFFEFYRETMCVTNIEPNIIHYKLAKLEEKGKLQAIITQNVDGLHQKAGSKNVIELHGTIHKNKCEFCGAIHDAEYIKNSSGIPMCNVCNSEYGYVKPEVTLYGEQLTNGVMWKAKCLISKSDLIIIAGTSLSIYPAAGLLDYRDGQPLVIINKQSTEKDWLAQLVINDDMVDVFKNICI